MVFRFWTTSHMLRRMLSMKKDNRFDEIFFAACTTSSVCFWCPGSPWVVACWRIKEVWWRETSSQSRSCKIVSLYPVVLEYLTVKINIIPSTTATVSVSYFTTKSETLPWFYRATSGIKQEGWEWKKNNVLVPFNHGWLIVVLCSTASSICLHPFRDEWRSVHRAWPRGGDKSCTAKLSSMLQQSIPKVVFSR